MFSQLREFLLQEDPDSGSQDAQEANHDRVKLLQDLMGEPLSRRLAIYSLPDDFLLSVVVPVYNEIKTIEEVLRRVRHSGVKCEIILIDDGSTDGTRELLAGWSEEPDLKIILQEKNQGKGAAIKTGFAHATGQIVIIQDADLEYDPQDYLRLLQPIVEDQADVVYGSRFSSRDRRVSRFWHQMGNRLITLLSNMITNLKLTDVETCYKVFRLEVIQRIAPTLQEKGFGIELEITAKLARMKDLRFYERPIRYFPRSYADGKKINWRDAVHALWCLLRY